MPDRGQTELLGTILIFAMVTISIGMVYSAGFSSLLEAREFEQTTNAQRAFEVFADNMEDITLHNAPSRTTEIKLSGATLSVAEPIEVQIKVTGTTINETYSVRPLIYSADTGERIIYVQGAVLREAGDNAVIARERSMILNDTRSVIPVIRTRLVGSASVGGSTTVLVRASHAQTDIVYLNQDDPATVWFNVSSPRAATWADHLESRSGVSDCEVSIDRVACRVESDRVAVTLIQIDLSLE